MGSSKLGCNLGLTLHGFFQIGLNIRPNFTWVKFLLMQYQYKSTAAKTFPPQSALCPFISHFLMFCNQHILWIKQQIHFFLSCAMWCVFHSCFLFSVHCMGKKERLHCFLLECSLWLKMECKMLYNMQILRKGNQTRMLFITQFSKCPPFFFFPSSYLSDILQVSLEILKNNTLKFLYRIINALLLKCYPTHHAWLNLRNQVGPNMRKKASH